MGGSLLPLEGAALLHVILRLFQQLHDRQPQSGKQLGNRIEAAFFPFSAGGGHRHQREMTVPPAQPIAPRLKENILQRFVHAFLVLHKHFHERLIIDNQSPHGQTAELHLMGNRRQLTAADTAQ